MMYARNKGPYAKEFRIDCCFEQGTRDFASFARKKSACLTYGSEIQRDLGSAYLGRTDQKHHQRPQDASVKIILVFNKEAERQG
jgi:hypothetical protein